MNPTTATNLKRRNFLKNTSALALAVVVLEFGTLPLLGCSQTRSLSAAAEKPASVSWKATIVADGERGEPLASPEPSTHRTVARRFRE